MGVLIKPAVTRARGFFSIFNFIVDVMKNLDEKGHNQFFVDLTTFNAYVDKPGDNPWDYAFAPQNISFKPITIIKGVNDLVLIDTLNFNEQDMSQYKRRMFSDVITKYIHLNDNVQRIVDGYVKENFTGKVLAVHRRATDMLIHFPIIPLPKFFEYVDKELESFDKIFLSTDCITSMKAFQNRYGDKVLTYGKILGYGDQAIFKIDGINKREHVVELVTNVYLMAKCDKLLRTNSNISLFVTVLNPDMSVHNIQTGYKL